MDRNEAVGIINSTGAEMRSVAEQIADLGERMHALSQIIYALFRLFPDLAESPEAKRISEVLQQVTDLPFVRERPKGAEAVRQILSENEDRWFTVAEVEAELSRRGWLPHSENPRAAVRAALDRAIASREDIRYQKSRNDEGGTVYAFTEEGVEY